MVEEVDDGSTPAIISTTAAGIITGFNHAAERLLGVDATQVVGQVTPVVFHDPTELVRRGETYLTPAVAKFTLEAYCHQDDAKTGPLGKLTGRQREILQLIAEGRSTKQIAQRLDLSVMTVETHRAQLMERLEIHDVLGLVRLAIMSGSV